MDDDAFAHALDALDFRVLDVQDALEHAIAVHGVWESTEVKLNVWRTSDTDDVHTQWEHPGFPTVLQRGADSAHQILAKRTALDAFRASTDAFVAALDPLLLGALQALPPNGVHGHTLTARFTFTSASTFAQLRAAPAGRDTGFMWKWDSRAFSFALRTVRARAHLVGQGPWWVLTGPKDVVPQAVTVQAVDADTALAWLAATEVPGLLQTGLHVALDRLQLTQIVDGVQASVLALRQQM